MTHTVAVLLVNLGTPEAATPAAVRQFLRPFLSDTRVIEVPKFIWWFILRLIILPLRAKKVAHAYKEIWYADGSPLRVISERQCHALQQWLDATDTHQQPIRVYSAMTYGEPSIAQALKTLQAAHIDRVVVLPLYPQYSATSTGAVFDAIGRALFKQRNLPDLRFIKSYHQEPGYIQALADSIRAFWQAHQQPEKLVLSFHGVPEYCVHRGDPYFQHCKKTAHLLADALGLSENQWCFAFQSRFGPTKWLTPYLDDTLIALARAGTTRVHVVCPGFAADCLETLEEVSAGSKAVFLAAGGRKFHYIPALNDQPVHIQFLANTVRTALGLPVSETAKKNATRLAACVSTSSDEEHRAPA